MSGCFDWCDYSTSCTWSAAAVGLRRHSETLSGLLGGRPSSTLNTSSSEEARRFILSTQSAAAGKPPTGRAALPRTSCVITHVQHVELSARLSHTDLQEQTSQRKPGRDGRTENPGLRKTSCFSQPGAAGGLNASLDLMV